MNGNDRDTVYSSLRMICLKRPLDNIHPAVGSLLFLKRETFTEAMRTHLGAFDTFAKDAL